MTDTLTDKVARAIEAVFVNQTGGFGEDDDRKVSLLCARAAIEAAGVRELIEALGNLAALAEVVDVMDEPGRPTIKAVRTALAKYGAGNE